MRKLSDGQYITLSVMSKAGKLLATCVIFTLAMGMVGALGQIYIHDIIPTFFSDGEAGDSKSSMEHHGEATNDHTQSESSSDRGDLFSDLMKKESMPHDMPFYKNEQFVWTLKWTHIHLFGMNMIFILMGGITLLLNVRKGIRSWLIVLPFLGVLIDISAMWLKAFVSPGFFWLHIPGGGIFAIVFGYVSLRALWEMWGNHSRP